MTVPLRIALIGSQGKLGQAIAQQTTLSPETQLVWQATRDQPFTDPKPLRTSAAQVLIDVSTQRALRGHLEHARKAAVPLVIGTTGLTPEDWIAIQETSKTLPLFYAPNFSLGAALLEWMASFLAKQVPPEWDLDIIEMHHTQKKDAPSGTALALAQALEASSLHKRPNIHSLRIGSVLAEHTLLAQNPEESLSFTHKISSRSAFAKGALHAARFLVKQPPGLYGMQHFFSPSFAKV